MSKGWHDAERTFGNLIASVHEALSEARKAYRTNGPWAYDGFNSKPAGFAFELAIAARMDYHTLGQI